MEWEFSSCILIVFYTMVRRDYLELEKITDDKELNGALYLDGDKVCIYKREVKNTYQYAVLYSILDFIQSYMFIPLRKST
mgnify:CR=1 FL=1